jgi:sortase (surface protein transpeptidase)
MLKQKIGYILISAGVVLGVLAIVLAYGNRPKQIDQLSPPNFSSGSDAASNPSKPDIDSYSVPPTHPKLISIPSLEIPKSKVLEYGLDQNHTIISPSSSYDTGWYGKSAKPGQQGAMFIYGHVAGPSGGGIFYNLKELKTGDKIVITQGDDKTYIYQVVASKIYPYDSVDMSAVLSPIEAGVPGLNLMTCTGKIIPESNPVNFDERLVVFTKIVKTD